MMPPQRGFLVVAVDLERGLVNSIFDRGSDARLLAELCFKHLANDGQGGIVAELHVKILHTTAVSH